MPNIAVTLRQEITRLARKEIKREAGVLRKASAQYRRLIAELRRETRRLQSDLLRFAMQASREGPQRGPDADSKQVRFSAKSVISQRRRLGLSAADFGKLVGVTGHTIYKWEHGTSRPRRAQVNALGELRALGRKAAKARLERAADSGKKRRGRR